MHRATATTRRRRRRVDAPLHRLARSRSASAARALFAARRRWRRRLQLSSRAPRLERHSARWRFADNARVLNGLDKFLLFVALPGGGARLADRGDRPRPDALVRLARQRGLAVRPVRARRRADLPAAVDRDAADRPRLPAPHRRDRARQRRRRARALHRPGVLLLLVPPRRAPGPLVLVQPRRPPLGERAEPVGGVPDRHPRPRQRQRPLLRAADLDRLRPAGRLRDALAQPALPVLDPRDLDPEARLARDTC